jgi:propionyl-CoA carboxylase alpha chain
MFQKLLIANRGEIACRIIKTANRLGVRTVAIYSDEDRSSLHTELADEAILIGSSPAVDSYLNIKSIVAACLKVGADAVHPGYGFLSENPEFVRALEEVGMVFVGPSVRAIQVMGDKIASKQLAASLGVPVISGHGESLADGDEAIDRAQEIGYPVMLKASAGGGGKGLRVAFNNEECREGFERARNEAMASFNDPRILIEKYIVRPRHIEIQVIGDKHGNSVYLGERECSIQRRHQKVLEESPSPFVDESMRRAMGKQALVLADAVNYFSAGTVEFIVNSDGCFYFLEMNTRLQVEHPVTEMTLQIDLVELMLRIAAGEHLPFSQRDIKSNGWAIESRIYAEDPNQNFLPETGRIYSYREPTGIEAVRVDTGVREGDEISIYYDPMLAKLVTYGQSRSEAIDKMTIALDQFSIEGVMTNIPLLSQIVRHPKFIRGILSTDFFQEEYPDGFYSGLLSIDNQMCLAALVTALDYNDLNKRHQFRARDKISRHVRVQGGLYKTTCTHIDSTFRVKIDSSRFIVELESYASPPQVMFQVNGKSRFARIRRSSFRYQVFFAGTDSIVTVLPPEVDVLHQFMPTKQVAAKSNYVLAPMPGLLVSLLVKPDQIVRSGDQLAVIEAMKMENSLKVERDAIISEILVTEGQVLEKDQAIIKLGEAQ